MVYIASKKLLQALPKLREAKIEVPKHVHSATRVDWTELALFSRYAFTDERRDKIWKAAAALLKDKKLQQNDGQVDVVLSGSDGEGEQVEVLGYDEWLAVMELQRGDEVVTAHQKKRPQC